MEPEALALTLPIRRLVEFLLRTGSIDSRFTGFDRALEGARLHRKLQRAAVKEYPDYQAEAALKQDYACAQITYTLEGRADGIFTDTDGMPTIDEIKTTTLPPELITGEQSPEHWAQAQIYAAIYARQNGLPAMRVRLTYFQVDEELEFRFSHSLIFPALGILFLIFSSFSRLSGRSGRSFLSISAYRSRILRVPPFNPISRYSATPMIGNTSIRMIHGIFMDCMT